MLHMPSLFKQHLFDFLFLACLISEFYTIYLMNDTKIITKELKCFEHFYNFFPPLNLNEGEFCDLQCYCLKPQKESGNFLFKPNK